MLKVKDIMVRDVKSCNLENHIGEVARLMRDSNCGAVPIVNEKSKIVGIVTDRDVCLALTGMHPVNATIAVAKIMTRKVFVCTPEENIYDAINTMRAERVKRLPVIDRESGQLVGILSIDDIVLHSNFSKDKNAEEDYVNGEEVLKALKAICKYRRTAEIINQIGEMTMMRG